MMLLSRSSPPYLCRLLLLLLTVSAAVIASPALASVVDQFPSIPNAFTTASIDVNVRAVYDAAQLTWRNASAGDVLTSLISTDYVLCQSSGKSPYPSASTTAAIVDEWCLSVYGGSPIAQRVHWSMSAPPGLQVWNQSATTFRALSWDCLTYACDTENTISTTTGTGPAVVGGLNVGAACCGSTNSTFVLYNTRGVVVQASMLPVKALNQEALLLTEAYITALAAEAADRTSADESSSFSSLSSASTSTDTTTTTSTSTSTTTTTTTTTTAPTVNLTGLMDFCLIRQVAPPALRTDEAATGEQVSDGGVTFSVNAQICSEDVSDRIDVDHAALVMTGYTLVLSTADGADELAFPKELIGSMMAWVAYQSGTSSGSLASSQSLRRKKGVCTWLYKAEYATAYRTGDYVECVVSDPTLLSHLPPLVLSVRNESIVNTEDTNSTCSFAIDLRACATADGKLLRFFSTGSLMDELMMRENAMTTFRDLPIVVGVQHLRGATLALTRNAYISKWVSSDFNIGYGLPLLYLATPRGTAREAYAPASSWPACVQPQTCLKRQIFYPSLNLCATKECTTVFLYHFDADTFECSVRVSIASLFSAMCFGVLVAEAVVLYLRRSTEQAKEEHMRLVHAVQRRNAEAQ